MQIAIAGLLNTFNTQYTGQAAARCTVGWEMLWF